MVPLRSIYTIANVKAGGEFSRSEQHPSKRFPGAGAAELYERMLAERGDRPLRPEPESLPKHITSAREAFAFLNQTGGEIFVKIAEKTTPLAADFYLLRSDEELEQEAA